MDPIPPQPRRGRGAISQPTPRFDAESRSIEDDGWERYGEDLEPAPLRTTVQIDASKSILTRNASPDIPFDRSINAYRGCEHGCVYCFARPSHAYLGLSPGLDFETRLFVKPEAPALLLRELAKPSYVCKPIAMGTNTDPYQPVERDWQVTRRLLEVLRDHDHPVSIVTKSALIQRDIDILAPMAAKKLVCVGISITTLDRELARKLEPRAPTPERRLDTVAALAKAGIPVTVMAAPVIPALTDSELEAILAAAAARGAGNAGYVLLRLPHEVKDLFAEWLAAHVPDRAAHVLSLVRDTRAGELYNSRWGERMRGEGAYADLIAQRFRIAAHRHRLDRHPRGFALDCKAFRRPNGATAARDKGQMSLF
jgi:DNA repair photolyase